MMSRTHCEVCGDQSEIACECVVSPVFLFIYMAKPPAAQKNSILKSATEKKKVNVNVYGKFIPIYVYNISL